MGLRNQSRQANLLLEEEIKLYVKNLVFARFPLDNEIKHVAVAEVSPEEESDSKI